jgi:hypothetical protein
MWIIKGLLLALWLVGFGTLTRLYVEIRRIHPRGAAISVSPGWVAYQTIRSVLWWTATLVCVAGSFALTRMWKGPLAPWIVVAITDLIPAGAFALYAAIFIKLRTELRKAANLSPSL